MLNDIFLYFRGYRSVLIMNRDRPKAVVMLYEKKIKVCDIRACGECVAFCFSLNDADNALGAFKDAEIEIVKSNDRGVIPILSRYKNRPGIFVGFVMILIAVFLSGDYIWCIRIQGNENVSDERILEILEDHGVYLGVKAATLDLHTVYNDILIDCDELSWISINIRGTVADVELRESNKPLKKTPPKGRYANLVAEYDGEITLIKTYIGNSVISVGDVVKKGELLVSGVYENKMGNVDVVYSRGEVFAKVRHEFSVEVPLNYEKKTYTGKKNEKISLKIFSNSINILNNSRNIVSSYDIIEKMERLYLPGDIVLPIAVERVSYLEYESYECIRTEAQAERIAYERANRQIISLADGGDMISKEYNGYSDGTNYILEVCVIVNTDIAKVQEFVYNEG